MDKRMVDFIRALRAAGVRISLAESQDAMYGVDVIGVTSRDQFNAALKTTLVKEARDQKTFDYFFPLFFGSGQPPMENIPDNLSPEDQQTLQQALQSMMGDMQALKDLLNQLLQGQPFSKEQLDQMGQQAGLEQGSDMYQRQWFERRMNRQMGMEEIQALIDMLMEQLEEMGMNGEAREQVREMLEQNAEGLAEQVSQYVGATLAEQMANEDPQPKPDLLDVPFNYLGHDEAEAIRDEIKRLAARLRSRASLRQKRSKIGDPDPRKTLRANMRYGGVPLELKYRTHHVKPCLVLICDISTSMRYCAEFLLTLVYELQDQVARTNSFIFIDDITDISMVFKEEQPRDAVERVLSENRPGYYNTDLGNSLDTFTEDFMSTVDHRTTVIILGDGRNNYNDPRLDLASNIQRRARRLIWFNPEPPHQWGTGDSDMHRYVAHADGVYKVSTLRELAAAVDKILTSN
ncbi:MAG: VWA domain-containing protein [Anaerolineae bacterium]|nr:VWA domain-containing protein [Anaerolineae bacterium]